MRLRHPRRVKRSTNPSLNAKAVEMARELGMNLSQMVNELLAQEIRRRCWARWNEDNKDAICSYNARIESDGLPLAKYRSFLKGR
jgi:antitoxin CcdA